MGKGEELLQHLQQHPLRPGERWPVRPELRVRDDTPSAKINKLTRVQSVLGRLSGGTAGIVLRDGAGAPQAVILSAERYAELGGCEVESESRFRAAEGRVEPSPGALEELMIEQTDPDAEWKHGSRIWPLKPANPQQ